MSAPLLLHRPEPVPPGCLAEARAPAAPTRPSARPSLSSPECRTKSTTPACRRVLVAATVETAACLRGVARYARAHRWHLVTDVLQTGAYPRGWAGDGIVALCAHRHDLLAHLRRAALPCVVVALSDEGAPFPLVRGDEQAVGRMAADHLLDRAYRSFAWAPFIGDRINRERFHGFATRLAEHGCGCLHLPPMHRRIGDYWHDDWADYRSALLAKLAALPRPSAVFAANDCVAMEIGDACRELGMAVPDELAVLGVGNDVTLCESAWVPLSSVELEVEEMAYQAAVALDEIMQGRAVRETLVVPPKRVVTRLSTDTCAVANSQVAKALSYIAEHFPEPSLCVAQVAAAVGLSRRHLERTFRTEAHCTVHEQVIKRRMQEASRLLRAHPRAKVADIAGLVGLDGAGAFYRTFRRFFGESPKAHRQSALRPAELPVEPAESARESA